MSTFVIGLVSVIGLLLLAALGFLVRDVFQKMSGSGVILLTGLFLIFVGERVFGVGDWRLPVSLAGLAVVLGAVALRGYALSRSGGQRRNAHKQALLWMGVVVLSLLMYGLTLEAVTGALGFDEEALSRWQGVWYTLFPIATLVGLVPVFLLDRVLAVHPVLLPRGATRSAQLTGVVAALAVALVFPVNYLADEHDETWDVAYFRTTRPGESTRAVVATVAEPIEATLFFPPGNDVGRETQAYFEELAKSSGGLLTVNLVDQAVVPELAEELKVRDNGQVVLRQGDNDQKFRLDTDMDRAKRDLRQLDSMVHKHLLKLTRGARTVYFLTGHGEASDRERDEPLRKLGLYKREILEAQNLKVKTLGVTEGSATEIPEDAAAVVIAAPEKPLLPEEVEALKAYWDEGGALFVLLDPKMDPLTDLLAHIGVTAGTEPLANAQVYVSQRRGKVDRVWLASNKFGSHPAVKTLARNSRNLGLILPTVVSVEKTAGTKNKVSTLVRSFPDTFVDANGNFEADEGEEKKVYELAVAVSRELGKAEGDEEPREARALVVGDVNMLADPILQVSQGNAIFALDGTRFLVGDEDIAGAIENEEDVKIQHTRDEDVVWFYLTIFAVPAMVLGAGLIFIRLRRRSS